MLTIRFSRVGKKNKAQYRIMLQDKTSAPGGRHVEVLGSYDPHSKSTVFKEDRIKYWISKGAQASDTVYNLLVKNGLIEGKKRSVKLPAKKVEEIPATETVATEAKTESEVKEEKKEDVKTEEVKTEEVVKEEVSKVE